MDIVATTEFNRGVPHLIKYHADHRRSWALLDIPGPWSPFPGCAWGAAHGIAQGFPVAGFTSPGLDSLPLGSLPLGWIQGHSMLRIWNGWSSGNMDYCGLSQHYIHHRCQMTPQKQGGTCKMVVRRPSEVAVMKWHYNKAFLKASRVHGIEPQDSYMRWSAKEKCHFTVHRPTVAEYSKHMGGVDLCTRKWTIRSCISLTWLPQTVGSSTGQTTRSTGRPEKERLKNVDFKLLLADEMVAQARWVRSTGWQEGQWLWWWHEHWYSSLHSNNKEKSIWKWILQHNYRPIM